MIGVSVVADLRALKKSSFALSLSRTGDAVPALDMMNT
jgi:hypothetical protein